MSHRNLTNRRHLCRQCGDHPAGWVDRRGRFRARADHDLCPRCFQAALDQAWACPLDAVGSGRSLDDRLAA